MEETDQTIIDVLVGLSRKEIEWIYSTLLYEDASKYLVEVLRHTLDESH